MATSEDVAIAAHALARHAAAGATTWCVAPSWAEHARHVAVEFVHPVVVGARALPAVSVVTDDPVGALRAVAASGDVLVLIGAADTSGVHGLLRRAGAWGLLGVWIGAGRRPAPGAADHVLWVEDRPAGVARHDGSVVRLYHLLWELTHVCLEHGGFEPALADRDAGRCTTCSDEGRPGEVVAVAGDGTASVRTPGGIERVDTTLVPPLGPGDLVVIHAGTAIAVVTDDPPP